MGWFLASDNAINCHCIVTAYIHACKVLHCMIIYICYIQFLHNIIVVSLLSFFATQHAIHNWFFSVSNIMLPVRIVLLSSFMLGVTLAQYEDGCG